MLLQQRYAGHFGFDTQVATGDHQYVGESDDGGAVFDRFGTFDLGHQVARYTGLIEPRAHAL